MIKDIETKRKLCLEVKKSQVDERTISKVQELRITKLSQRKTSITCNYGRVLAKNLLIHCLH